MQRQSDHCNYQNVNIGDLQCSLSYLDTVANLKLTWNKRSKAAFLARTTACYPGSLPRHEPIIFPLPSQPKAHIPEQELGSFLIRVPVRETELHPEALAQIVKDLVLRGAALFHDNPQHLRDRILKERVFLFAFDELLENLIVRKVHKCLK